MYEIARVLSRKLKEILSAVRKLDHLHLTFRYKLNEAARLDLNIIQALKMPRKRGRYLLYQSMIETHMILFRFMCIQ